MIPVRGSALCASIVVLLTSCGGARVDAPIPASAAQPASSAFTADDYSAWKRSRAWTSREELFQLFSHLIVDDPQRSVRVDHATLAQIAPQMSSLFPLDACEEIDYRDRVLRVRFTSDQTVHVPRAYRQAELALSRELVLAVEPLADAPAGSLSFTIRAGSLAVEFSWLAKLLGPPYVRDFPIASLAYRLDDSAHASSLTAANEGDHPLSGLAVLRVGDEVTVDLLDAGHPRPRDIVISHDGIDFPCLGWHARLAEGDRVEINGIEHALPDMRAAIAWVVEQAFSDLDGLFANGFRLDERYRYDLEARAIAGMAFTWNFKP